MNQEKANMSFQWLELAQRLQAIAQINCEYQL